MSMGNRPSFSRETKLQWAGSRERISPSGRGGAFFLTFLFIELIDLLKLEMEKGGQSKNLGPIWVQSLPKTRGEILEDLIGMT